MKQRLTNTLLAFAATAALAGAILADPVGLLETMLVGLLVGAGVMFLLTAARWNR